MKEPGTNVPEGLASRRQGLRFGLRGRDVLATLEVAILGILLAWVLFASELHVKPSPLAWSAEVWILTGLVVLARVLAVPIGGTARFLLPIGELWILVALFALEPVDVLFVAACGEFVGQFAVGVRRRFLDEDRREFFARDEFAHALLAMGEGLLVWSAVVYVHEIVRSLLTLPEALQALVIVLAVVSTTTLIGAATRQLFQKLRGLADTGPMLDLVDAKTFGLRLIWAPIGAFLAQQLLLAAHLEFALGASVLVFANLLTFQLARSAEREREKVRLLQLLRGAASAVHAAASFDRMLERFCEDARRVVPSLSMYVALRRPGEETFDYVFFDDGGGQWIDLLGAQHSRLAQERLLSLEPWCLDSIDREPEILGSDPVLCRLERRPRSLLGVRLEVKEEPIGVALFWSYRAYAFREAIAGALVTLVDFVGTAISNLRMVERIQHAEGRYRALFENAGDGIAILDPDGVVVESNARFREIVRAFVDRVHGKLFQELFPRDQRSRIERLRRRSQEEHIVGEGFLLRGPTGESFELAMGMGALRLDEGPRTLVHVRDRSESARLERQLADIHRMAGVGKLASGIAHDLNNLLGVILGHTYRLSETQEPHADSLRAIRQSAMEGATMTKRLLQYGRGTTLERVPVVLDEFVRGSLPLLRGALPANVEVEFESEVRDLLIPLDPGQMQQVLLNLVINAGHAMPNGGTVTIRLSMLRGGVAPDEDEERITAVVDDPFQGDWARIEVVDRGSGIDPRYRDKIFEPFFSTRDREHGHGLGLFVSQVIVQAHRGRITFQSLAGLGTTFRIDIPIGTELAIELSPPPLRTEEPPRTNLLLFQADVETADRLESVLRTQGYGLERVQTLEGLRQRLEGRQRLPVFVDVTYGGAAMMEDVRHEFPRTDFLWIVETEEKVQARKGEVLLERRFLYRVEFDLLFRALRVSRVPTRAS